jgi:hypothetical protein
MIRMFRPYRNTAPRTRRFWRNKCFSTIEAMIGYNRGVLVIEPYQPAFPPSYLLAAIAAIVWALSDFSAPHSWAEVKFATRRYRYFFAKYVYAAGAVIGFTLIYEIVDTPFAMFSSYMTLRWLSAAIALLLGGLLLQFGPLRRFVSVARKSTQDLAQYPYARDRLAALLARSKLLVDDAAAVSLEKEMKRYGVSPNLLRATLPISARICLLEIRFLKERSATLFQDKDMRCFCDARKGAIREIEASQRRLLRRTARTIKVIEERQKQIVSELVVEAAQEVLQSCRKLVAEAALSTKNSTAASNQFVRQWGFEVDKIAAGMVVPPILPLILVFVGYCLLFTFPIVLARLGLGSGRIGVGADSFVRLLIPQAVGQMIAIALAVFTKQQFAVLRFVNLINPAVVRPIVLGALSYIVGLTISILVMLGAQGQFWKFFDVRAISLFSMSYPLLTVSLDLAIDRRLSAESNGRPTASPWWDAVAFAIIFLMANIIIQFLVKSLTPFRPLGWPFYLVWLAFGLLIGYSIPKTAAAYLMMKRRDLDYDSVHGPYSAIDLNAMNRVASK